MSDQLLVGILFATIISVSSYLARFLTFGGSVAQFILGTLLLGIGGWQWTVPMLMFFVLSSVLSNIGKAHKAVVNSFFQKIHLNAMHARDHHLYIAYLGAVAAATADTLGTEIGTLSRTSPVLITTFRPAQTGRSGGVSLLGIVAGLLGALSIWVSAFFGLDKIPISLIAIVVGGLMGSILDSAIGATLQAQFRCGKCGKLTEREVHCGHLANLTRGTKHIGNDNVNLVSTFVEAIAAYIFYGLMV